jgi:hypothetical protein
MSKKSSSTTKLLLVAGVAGVAYYLYKSGALNNILPAGAPSAPAAVNPLAITSTQQAVTNSAATSLPPVTSNDPRVTTIMQWMNTLTGGNKTAALNALPQMSQSEIAGLYDIVANDFYGNGITTGPQTTFWNAWRVKYHVLDGTYTS